MTSMTSVLRRRKRQVVRTPRFHVDETRLTAVLFLLPAVLIFAVFVLWPITKSARYSFYEWNGVGPLQNYVGFENYRTLINDPIFWSALKHNIIVVLWSIATQIPLAIGLALLLTRGLKGSNLFRTLYFCPYGAV